MHRRVSIVLLLLASACNRVPADVSTPGTEVVAPAPAPGQRASTEPISSDCKDSELASCAESCQDSACLEWCAGESCGATLASLWSCMDEAERRFAAERPTPQIDYEIITTDDGESYQQPTAESIEREYDWQDAHDRMLDERWSDVCEPMCSTRLATNDEGSIFCTDWRSSYHAWERLSQPPPEPGAFGVLSMAGSLGMLGALSLGTTMWLEGELAQRYDDPHAAALMHMISRVGWRLSEAERCVPDIDENGREFSIGIELDPNGVVQATHLRDDANGGDCVANVVASALTLPVRVARDYPQLEVRVLVKPVPNFGGIEGFGIDYDSGLGDYGDVGDGYGTVGTGGGGSGYGTVGTDGGLGGRGLGGGGSGDIHLDPPPPPPADDGD